MAKPEKEVIKPQSGPQEDALKARHFCEELLVAGGRGSGKSFFLLMDYASDVDNYGKDWHGVIFRQSYPQLTEIVRLSQDLYPSIFGDKAEFKVGSHEWHFPSGAVLRLRHLDTDADALNYHGHSYQWLGFDEITNWSTDVPYKRLIATLRSTNPDVFKRVRATCNPSGPGMSWVKRRFIEPAPKGYQLVSDEETGMSRMFIPLNIESNRILLEADPDYINRIRASTQGNEQLMRAWLKGDWDVFFGQFFSMFDPLIHRADPMEVLGMSGGVVPPNWRLEAGLDYGEAQHTAFLLFATDPEGTSYLLDEYYRDGRWLDEHAGSIRALCEDCKWTGGRFPERIWADTRIFTTRAASGYAAQNRMVSDVFRHYGLRVVKSNKDRLAGWRWLKNELAWKRDPDTGEWLKKPRIYHFPDCRHYEGSIQTAQYAGTEQSPSEDLNEKGEDHIPDALRYFCMGAHSGRNVKKEERTPGLTFGDLMENRRRAESGLPSSRYGFEVKPYEWKESDAKVAT